METQTEIKVPYELLTDYQKEEICNGCGGKGGWVKPPFKAFFKTSCNHHDYGYWCGVTEADRLANDKGLSVAMYEDCMELPFWKMVIYGPWCRLYYRGVRKVGKKFFYYGKKKRYPVPTEEQLEKIKYWGKLKSPLEKIIDG